MRPGKVRALTWLKLALEDLDTARRRLHVMMSDRQALTELDPAMVQEATELTKRLHTLMDDIEGFQRKLWGRDKTRDDDDRTDPGSDPEGS